MSLELIIGPMFAGKTSALQSIIRRHQALGMPCIAYKPLLDDRQGTEEYMQTHDGVKVSARRTASLKAEEDTIEYINSKLIVIEEGQFFPDLYSFVMKAVETHKKNVVVAGLDGDRFRKPFGQLLELIPIADRVTKLTSLCKLCANGTVALFSYCNTTSTDTVHVGGIEKYMPLCRAHYLKSVAIARGDCPDCAEALVGSVYRPRCSKCPWDSDTCK